MSEKKGYPAAPQAPAGYVPAPPHPAAAAAYAASAAPQQLAGSPYTVYQQLYPGQAPPTYDSQIPAIMAAQQFNSQMYPHVGMSSAMYSQAANPAGYYASAFTPMQAYYHPLAYSYPQPQLRPAIMIPNGYDPGARKKAASSPDLVKEGTPFGSDLGNEKNQLEMKIAVLMKQSPIKAQFPTNP
ncbi:DAZ associated protein 2 [Nesidiocoris tenuis]|uniref:DAZ associated protein 2 n=1 Tax=Nesidiocoris tenuis TaxID=355587 RepID=A0ABN7B3T5_9HEMI|nr:DAZ associated protein 2 [Nesidiocoris tenuis]